MNTDEEDNMSMLWQSQPLEVPRISLEYVRHQVEKLNADFRHECRVMYAVTILSAVVLLINFVQLPFQSQLPSPAWLLISRLGSAFLLLGSIYLTLQVRRRGKILQAKQDEKVVHGLSAYRIELQERKNYCLSAWRWSLWPIVPTIAIFLIGGLLYDTRPGKLMRFGLLLVMCIVGALLGSWHYYLKGKKFQQELDALDTLYK